MRFMAVGVSSAGADFLTTFAGGFGVTFAAVFLGAAAFAVAAAFLVAALGRRFAIGVMVAVAVSSVVVMNLSVTDGVSPTR